MKQLYNPHAGAKCRWAVEREMTELAGFRYRIVNCEIVAKIQFFGGKRVIVGPKPANVQQFLPAS